VFAIFEIMLSTNDAYMNNVSIHEYLSEANLKYYSKIPNLKLVDSYKHMLCFFKGEIYIKSQGYSYESNMTHIATSKKMRDYSVQFDIRGTFFNYLFVRS